MQVILETEFMAGGIICNRIIDWQGPMKPSKFICGKNRGNAPNHYFQYFVSFNASAYAEDKSDNPHANAANQKDL